MDMQLVIGLILLLLFFYLKNKPQKEGSGFISYIATLLVLAVLLIMGVGLVIGGFGTKESSIEPYETKVSAATSSTTEEILPKKEISKPTPTIQQVSPSKWHHSQDVSPMDDSITYTSMLKADQPIGNQFGRKIYPILAITCNKGKTDVCVAWKRFITIGKSKITTRINKESATSSMWTPSKGGKATYSPSGYSFCKILSAKSGKLTVQAEPYRGRNIVAVFDINGFKDELQTIASECHW